MEELVEKNTVPKEAFPKLVLRHARECSRGEESEIAGHRQLHEIYMYTFFRAVRKDAVGRMRVGQIEGLAIGPVHITNLSLRHQVDESGYFRFLLRSPLPFVFIPAGKLRSHAGMCRGAYFFKDGEKEGILMDLLFACEVGLDFLAAEYLARSDVGSVYIGLARSLADIPRCQEQAAAQ